MCNESPTELRCRILIGLFYVLYYQSCQTRPKVYPTKQIKNPWMDQDLTTLCKHKNNLYNLYKQVVVSYYIFTNFRN